MFGTEIMYLNSRNNVINTERRKKTLRGKTCEYGLHEGFSDHFQHLNKHCFCTLKCDINLSNFSFSGAHLKPLPRQEDILTVTSFVGEKVEMKEQEVMQCTAYGKVLHDLTHSEKVMNDLTLGRRAGLYELRGEIGSGNFSHVRLGIHDLTKGETLRILPVIYPHFHSFSDQ